MTIKKYYMAALSTIIFITALIALQGCNNQENISLDLEETSIQIQVGETYRLNATVSGNNSIAWESGNNAVATVDASGLVRGVAIGAATIEASCGGKTAVCEVTVGRDLTRDFFYLEGRVVVGELADLRLFEELRGVRDAEEHFDDARVEVGVESGGSADVRLRAHRRVLRETARVDVLQDDLPVHNVMRPNGDGGVGTDAAFLGEFEFVIHIRKNGPRFREPSSSSIFRKSLARSSFSRPRHPQRA